MSQVSESLRRWVPHTYGTDKPQWDAVEELERLEAENLALKAELARYQAPAVTPITGAKAA